MTEAGWTPDGERDPLERAAEKAVEGIRMLRAGAPEIRAAWVAECALRIFEVMYKTLLDNAGMAAFRAADKLIPECVKLARTLIQEAEKPA